MMNEKTPKSEAKMLKSKESRRRLLAGGAGVGVLASLKSGSALAEGLCASPSAFTSITLNPATSRRPQQLPTCHSHGYWKKKDWPISRETTVNGAGFCIGSRLTAIGISANTKLIDILDMKGGGSDRALAADLISAYLDAAAGFVQGQFTINDIQKMWALVFCGHTYSVNGTAWSEQTVRAFLDVLVGKNKSWP